MADEYVIDVHQNYAEDEPYIFISYAHVDSEVVFPLLSRIQQAGYRIWFDQGIESGTIWTDTIAEHVVGCAAFLWFASSASASSKYCLNELAYAERQDKPTLMVFIEDDVALPSGVEMTTGRFQQIFLSHFDNDDECIAQLNRTSILEPCRCEPMAEEESEDEETVPAEEEETESLTLWQKMRRSPHFKLYLMLEILGSILGTVSIILGAIALWPIVDAPATESECIVAFEDRGFSVTPTDRYLEGHIMHQIDLEQSNEVVYLTYVPCRDWIEANQLYDALKESTMDTEKYDITESYEKKHSYYHARSYWVRMSKTSDTIAWECTAKHGNVVITFSAYDWNGDVVDEKTKMMLLQVLDDLNF